MSEAAAEWVALDALTPWEDNPRDNDAAVQDVADSIKRFGFASPIIARREDGEVIAGHTRLKAARRLGLDRVPVRFLDLDPTDARLLALADNKLGELADWSDGLADVLRILEEDGADLDGLGFSDEEMAELLGPDPIEPDGTEDDVPEVQSEVHSQAGEVYELGPHRLICGDSTDSSIWEKLMGEERLQMVWTDPPYGVSYVGGTKDALTIQNDDLSANDLRIFLGKVMDEVVSFCQPGSAWYVASPAGPLFFEFAFNLNRLGIWKHTLLWLKDRLVLGRCDYHYRHEAIFYGWVPGAAHYFIDDRTQDSVIECKRPSVNKEHPTMKPVQLIQGMLENSSKLSWLVGDPFGGSGSTLIACAMTGRVARLIELDPKYCDVIRRRWTRWAIKHGQDPGSGALADAD